jgi:hypothetical protein
VVSLNLNMSRSTPPYDTSNWGFFVQNLSLSHSFVTRSRLAVMRLEDAGLADFKPSLQGVESSLRLRRRGKPRLCV